MKFLWLACLLLTGTLWAQEEVKLTVADVHLYGVDLALGQGPWTLTSGAAWQQLPLGRDSVTGEPREGKPEKLDIADGTLRLGYTWTLPEGKLTLSAGVFGYDNLARPEASPAFADYAGGLFGLAGAGWVREAVVKNDHGQPSGTSLSVTAEGSPAALSLGATDYFRLGGAAVAYVPLWDLPGENQLFYGVLALRAGARWTDGGEVPLPLLEGTEVRGYATLYDAKRGTVASAELRLAGPSLWDRADIVPVLFGFAEAGSYSGYSHARAAADRQGWLASVGGGLALDLKGITAPTITLALPLNEETALWWDLDFNYRY